MRRRPVFLTGLGLVPVLVLSLVVGAVTPTPSGAEPVVTIVTCEAAAPMTPTGSVTVSVTIGTVTVPVTVPVPELGEPIADALDEVALPLPVPVEVAATDQIQPGGTVDYGGDLAFDPGTSLQDVMEPVRAAISDAGYPEVAESLDVRASLTDLRIAFPHPVGATGTGTPTATGAGTAAAHDGGALVVTVDAMTLDTTAGIDTLDTRVDWSVLDGGTAPPATLTQHLGTIAYDFAFTIEAVVPGELITPLVPEQYQALVPDQVPVTAGTFGPWTCVPDEPAPALASTVVASTVPDIECTSGFTDVGATHRFCVPIAWARTEGLVEGWPDGTFRPTWTSTRQAFAAMLHRAAGEPPAPIDAPTFSDVGADHPFGEAIAWLAHSGITTGYDDGTYRPTAPVTRQAAAAMFHRRAGEPPAPVDAPTFSDVGADHPFAEAIAWLAHSGITTGYDDGTFRPGAAVARQALAAFFQRSA
jgi:hypothetical protein